MNKDNTIEKRAGFTQGPWIAWYCEENKRGGGIFQGTDSDTPRMICRMANNKRVIHKDKRKSDDFIHSAEDESNARLIANSPAMYEQCKLFERMLASLANHDHWMMTNCNMLAQVRELLAKVDGGEG